MKTVSLFSFAVLNLCILIVYCKAQNGNSSLKRRNSDLRVSLDAASRYQQRRRGRHRERSSNWPKSEKRFSPEHQPRFRRQRLQQRNAGKSLITRLAAHIQRILLSINCRRAKRYLTTSQRCSEVQSTSFKQMRFYLAPPRPNTLYSVILPDGKLKDFTTHHGVAVVDPFPNVAFGHLVLIFYVDQIPKASCKKRKGVQIGPLLCLTLARKTKCRNLHRAQLSSDEIVQKCEVNFLPLVYDEIHSNGVLDLNQELRCFSRVAGFGNCLKQELSPFHQNCELVQNNQGCQKKKLSSVKQKPMLCQAFSMCDRSALVFGEWNNLTIHPKQERNMQSMYKMLTRNGFQKNKIQLFYGGNGSSSDNKLFQNGMSSGNKNYLRRYITSLCKTSLCVDTLVLYLNGPTLADGSLLLRDINLNGEAEDNEMYKPDEIFDDVSNCAANNVIIFADQSYSGVLKKTLRQRLRSDADITNYWNRVVLLTSGGEYDYSWYNGATEHWSNLSPKSPISWGVENLGFLNSSPTLTSRHYAEDHTIYGAPLPRDSDDDDIDWQDLKRRHMGCQELPLSDWMMEFSSNLK